MLMLRIVSFSSLLDMITTSQLGKWFHLVRNDKLTTAYRHV